MLFHQWFGCSHVTTEDMVWGPKACLPDPLNGALRRKRGRIAGIRSQGIPSEETPARVFWARHGAAREKRAATPGGATFRATEQRTRIAPSPPPVPRPKKAKPLAPTPPPLHHALSLCCLFVVCMYVLVCLRVRTQARTRGCVRVCARTCVV